MKPLLFDQNLSPHLARRLADLFPGSNHTEMLGLGTALDKAVWEYARTHEYVIVTKDADFSELNVLFGFPPKVVWIRRGNCSTQEIEALLRRNYETIRALVDNPSVGILMLL